jgi:cytochrome P450
MVLFQHPLVVDIQAMDAVAADIAAKIMERDVVRVCIFGWNRGSVLIKFRSLLHPEWGYLSGHEPFEKMGMDVFIVASPSRNSVFVADAEAITQITTRRNDFPKPLEMYKSLDIYGKNLVSTEGADWRGHRKLVAPSFGDKNNELVFNETLHHAKSMLGLWAGDDGKGNLTVADPSVAAMNFALYVISGAGFDVRVVWPHEEGKNIETKKGGEDSIFVGSEAPPGYTMPYREALGQLLHNIMWTQIMPLKWLGKSLLTE